MFNTTNFDHRKPAANNAACVIGEQEYFAVTITMRLAGSVVILAINFSSDAEPAVEKRLSLYQGKQGVEQCVGRWVQLGVQ
jgi:hypothetical protein